MKTKYLIGNMKMNMDFATLQSYFKELVEATNETKNVVGVCVPSVYLETASNNLEGSNVLYGVQNMYYEDFGAYTGEISANMINDFDAKLVILGHSERRTYFHETDEDINLKVKKALEEGLTPVLCFGETKSERENGEEKSVVKTQVLADIDGLSKDDVKKIIFAYEPVWAIGTGLTATSEQAEEMIKFTKEVLFEKVGLKADEIICLYGGSMKGSNAKELLNMPSIDGGLIGGACLKVASFKEIFDIIVE